MYEREFIAKGHHVLTAGEAEALRAAVDVLGDIEVARRVGCSRQALARAVARFGIHAGTAALSRAYLGAQRDAA